MKRTILLSVIALALSIGLKAADISSAQSGDFFDPATWVGGVVPGVGDNVTISPNDSVGLHLTAVSGSVTIASLSFDNSSKFYTQTDDPAYSLIITNDLSLLAGSVDIKLESNVQMTDINFGAGSGSVIDIEPSYSVTSVGTLNLSAGTNSVDIYGTLNTDSISITGGSNSLNIYAGGVLNVTGGMSMSGNSSFIVFNEGSASVGGDLEVTGSSALTLDGSLSVDGNFDFINGDFDLTGDLTVGETLSLYNNAITGDGTISANLIECDAGTGEDCNDSLAPGIQVLPVDLIQFEALKDLNKIELLWKTASEEDNDYFTIERSSDAINFVAIGTVTGAGTSYSLNEYSFDDFISDNELVYYRLKQTDFNGEYSYSEVISPVGLAVLKSEANVNLSWTTEFIKANFGDNYKQVVLNLYAMDGKLVSFWKLPRVDKGNSVVLGASLEINNMYILEIQVENSEFVAEKILVK